MLTLWDLLKPAKRRAAERRAHETSPSDPQAPRAPKPSQRATATSRLTMRERYAQMQRDTLREYGVRVHRWRSSMTGCAWEVHYHAGGVSRLIEAPRPKGPMSAAIFLHEIGHHAVGFGVYKPRCYEEYKVWEWALAEMDRRGLNVTPAVRQRMRDSLDYAMHKARRRGLKHIPDEFARYLESPPTA